jgi:pimeloyl-ACP methyl ester carboxylesterase
MKWLWIIPACLLAVLAYGWWQAGRGETRLTAAAQENAPGEFLQLPGGRLHYQISGDGWAGTIVLVHGFSTPSFIFEQNAEALREAGFQVVQFDHFGRGWSDRLGAEYNTDFYDRELMGVLDGLELTQPVGLVGLSMGAPIVTEFAARHPQRVSRVFLFVPAGFDLNSGDTRLIRTPLIGDYLWRLNWRKTLLADKQYDETELAPENRLQGDVRAQMQYSGYSYALLSTLRHFPMSAREQTYQRFAQTGLPMKAIFGDGDATVIISSAEKLNRAVPQAEIRILSGADHGLNYKRHQDVNADLTAFFMHQ